MPTREDSGLTYSLRDKDSEKRKLERLELGIGNPEDAKNPRKFGYKNNEGQQYSAARREIPMSLSEAQVQQIKEVTRAEVATERAEAARHIPHVGMSGQAVS